VHKLTLQKIENTASLSFSKPWRWPDRNFLRCRKRWKSLGARSGL
jgi:hypothetical protein